MKTAFHTKFVFSNFKLYRYTAVNPRTRWDATNAQGFVLTAVLMQSWAPPFQYGAMNGPAWFVACLAAYWALTPRWLRVARLCRASGTLWRLLFLSYLASFTPTFVCYLAFDLPLYRRWYGGELYVQVEFNRP